MVNNPENCFNNILDEGISKLNKQKDCNKNNNVLISNTIKAVDIPKEFTSRDLETIRKSNNISESNLDCYKNTEDNCIIDNSFELKEDEIQNPIPLIADYSINNIVNHDKNLNINNKYNNLKLYCNNEFNNNNSIVNKTISLINSKSCKSEGTNKSNNTNSIIDNKHSTDRSNALKMVLDEIKLENNYLNEKCNFYLNKNSNFTNTNSFAYDNKYNNIGISKVDNIVNKNLLKLENKKISKDNIKENNNSSYVSLEINDIEKRLKNIENKLNSRK